MESVQQLTSGSSLCSSRPAQSAFATLALRRAKADADRALCDDAAQRAAIIGLTGILVTAIMLWLQLPAAAAKGHTTVSALLTSDPDTMLQAGFVIAAALGFVGAVGHIRLAWPIAAIGVVAGALHPIFLGKWTSLINLIHLSLAAGLWIGTLFVLVVAGLTTLLGLLLELIDRRGAIEADLVTWILAVGALDGRRRGRFRRDHGVRHLHTLSNLWLTSYGQACWIVKLVFVAGVFALGAWNWRRQRPTLGSEAAAVSLRRSAISELTIAGIVLICDSDSGDPSVAEKPDLTKATFEWVSAKW